MKNDPEGKGLRRGIPPKRIRFQDLRRTQREGGARAPRGGAHLDLHVRTRVDLIPLVGQRSARAGRQPFGCEHGGATRRRPRLDLSHYGSDRPLHEAGVVPCQHQVGDPGNDRIPVPEARQGGHPGTHRQVGVHQLAPIGESQQGGIQGIGGSGHTGAIHRETHFEGALGGDHDADAGGDRRIIVGAGARIQRAVR